MPSALWLAAALTIPAQADQLVISDLETDETTWRSKFSSHRIVETEREGEPTKALEVPYDFREGPGYLWARAMCEPPVDVRGYAYLSFCIKGDGSNQHVMPMLINLEEQDGEAREVVVSSDRKVVLDFEGWRHFSVPLETFGAPEEFLAAIQQVNFSLTPQGAAPQPRSLWLDDVALVGPEPVGEVVPEFIPYPPADIAVESDQALLDAMDLTRPELAAVAEAARAGDIDAAKQAWAEHLGTRTEPRWLWSRFDREKIIAAHGEHFGGMAKYRGAADRAIARDFDWLGVRKTLEHDIQWLQGPVEWTHVLSRFAYWGHLGKAYWGTGESKYAEDFVYTLEDWVADNPVPRILTNSRGKDGTVWRTLETGIRGDVWFDAMEMFMHAPEFDAEAKWTMTRSLVEQARHLHRYQIAFRYGNWQVVECTGLACIGIMLPELKEAEGWRERAFHYLVEHMERDVYDDGAHYEVTPGYHGWVMSLFMRAALLAERNGYEVPGLMDKHERMYEFLLKLSRPNRRAPSVGDAGGPGGAGITGNMALGALLYDRPDMRFLGVSKPQEQWLWLFGEEAIDRYADMATEPPAFESTYLPSSLYFTMRTGWEPEDKYFLLDCAPWGGGHSHADQLSIIAYANGEDLILDPGMYSYDQPLSREYLRFGKAHNVLLVDGTDSGRVNPEALSHDFGEDFDFVSGRVDVGVEGVAHTRSALFVRPDYWVVADHVSGEGEHSLQQLFHLPLGAEVDTSEARVTVTLKAGQRFLIENLGGGRPSVTEGWIPTGGASAERAPVVVFDLEAELPVSLAVLIYPLGDQDPSAVAAELIEQAPSAISLRITRPGATEGLSLAAEPGPLSLPGLSVDARAACVSERDGRRLVYTVDRQASR